MEGWELPDGINNKAQYTDSLKLQNKVYFLNLLYFISLWSIEWMGQEPIC